MPFEHLVKGYFILQKNITYIKEYKNEKILYQ